MDDNEDIEVGKQRLMENKCHEKARVQGIEFVHAKGNFVPKQVNWKCMQVRPIES